jgi:ribosomal protein L30E
MAHVLYGRFCAAWLVIIADNCPPLAKSEIEYYAMLAKTGSSDLCRCSIVKVLLLQECTIMPVITRISVPPVASFFVSHASPSPMLVPPCMRVPSVMTLSVCTTGDSDIVKKEEKKDELHDGVRKPKRAEPPLGGPVVGAEHGRGDGRWKGPGGGGSINDSRDEEPDPSGFGGFIR